MSQTSIVHTGPWCLASDGCRKYLSETGGTLMFWEKGIDGGSKFKLEGLARSKGWAIGYSGCADDESEYQYCAECAKTRRLR